VIKSNHKPTKEIRPNFQIKPLGISQKTLNLKIKILSWVDLSSKWNKEPLNQISSKSESSNEIHSNFIEFQTLRASLNFNSNYIQFWKVSMRIVVPYFKSFNIIFYLKIFEFRKDTFGSNQSPVCWSRTPPHACRSRAAAVPPSPAHRVAAGQHR
jgi:hypothetical protein